MLYQRKIMFCLFYLRIHYQIQQICFNLLKIYLIRYDKVLQNRKKHQKILHFLKLVIIADTNIFDSWIHQIYNINDHPLDNLNRDDLWSHDVPLIEYCNFKSKGHQNLNALMATYIM